MFMLRLTNSLCLKPPAKNPNCKQGGTVKSANYGGIVKDIKIINRRRHNKKYSNLSYNANYSHKVQIISLKWLYLKLLETVIFTGKELHN